MEPSLIQLALRELHRRRAVEQLLELNKVRQSPALAADRRYQRAFKAYYRMGMKSEQFYEVFFVTLRNAVSGSSILSLEEVLKVLNRADGKHLSFASKLLATVDDSSVIFDRNVAAFFGVSTTALPKKDWIRVAIQRYSRVCEGIDDILKGNEWSKIRELFDASFPNATALSARRKADLIVWAISSVPLREIVAPIGWLTSFPELNA